MKQNKADRKNFMFATEYNSSSNNNIRVNNIYTVKGIIQQCILT